jgi:hypothetical protein
VLVRKLLRLYPRAWRERYGEEFLETVGDEPVRLQLVIDIVSGAIDAWLSAEVRRTTLASRVTATGGRPMFLKSLVACGRPDSRYTRRDSLAGSGVMLAATLLFAVLGIAVKRGGAQVTGDILLNIAFPGALMLSMPFWLMKNQSWKAQVVIIGTTLTLLVLITYLALSRNLLLM